jgi:hypothetical protein
LAVAVVAELTAIQMRKLLMVVVRLAAHPQALDLDMET